MSKYQNAKAAAREAAIDWQLSFADSNYSWLDLATYSEKFEKLAKRYGLVREFRENGII